MSLLRLLVLFICLLPRFGFAQQLQCFHCINQLAMSDITNDEKNALKTALFTRFRIPPSSKYCADGGSELLFRTVEKQTCPGINDTCVRIVSQGDEKKKLVLRGCLSTLVKSGYDLVTNYSCRNLNQASSECITTCQQPLCNNSHGFSLIPLLIVICCLVL